MVHDDKAEELEAKGLWRRQNSHNTEKPRIWGFTGAVYTNEKCFMSVDGVRNIPELWGCNQVKNFFHLLLTRFPLQNSQRLRPEL